MLQADSCHAKHTHFLWWNRECAAAADAHATHSIHALAAEPAAGCLLRLRAENGTVLLTTHAAHPHATHLCQHGRACKSIGQT